MDPISVTAPTFHDEMGWLNFIAPPNMLNMVVTLATFHAEMSVLKKGLSANSSDMSVMAETSHVPMWASHAPTTEELVHALTAATRSALVVNMRGGGDGGGGEGGGDGGGGDGGGDGASVAKVCCAIAVTTVTGRPKMFLR